MPDTDEDRGDNRPEDMKIDDTILKLAEQYVGLENRARQLNKDKAAIREQADKIGVPSLAWQIGVRMVKMMDTGERADFQRGFRRVTTVLSKAAETLFPEDIERQKKRKARKAEAAAKAAAAAGKETPEQQVRRVNADTNPRSDPKRGGAGKKKPSTIAEAAAASDAALKESIANAEQEDGAKILDTAIDSMKDGTPKSQSAIAQEKLEAAKLA